MNYVPISECVKSIHTWNPHNSGETTPFEYIDLSSVDRVSKEISETSETIPAEAPSRARQIVVTNDVLVATVRPNLNGVAVVPKRLDGATASTGFCVLRSKENKLDHRYLFHWVKTPQFIQEMVKRSTGANYPAVSDKIVKSSNIPLPPLAEQKRIAAILDKADAIRRKRQDAIELVDTFLRSVFLKMFGDPVTNPMGWDVVEIAKACETIVDCVNRTAPIVDHETPFKMIRTTNVRNNKIDLSSAKCVDEDTFYKWNRRLTPKIGDIVFTREAPAGEAGIINFQCNVFLGQRTMLFRPDRKIVEPTFLLHSLVSNLTKAQIQKIGSGSTVKHLSVPECKKLLINLPPLSKQKEFREIASAINQFERRVVEGHSCLNSLFSSLQQRVFRGDL